MIAALAKAEALKRHTGGIDAKDTVIVLSDREARELLAHIHAQGKGEVLPHADLWVVMEKVRVEGFRVARLPDEVH